ncbi:MAG: rRNA maturation RNase YbeY [Saccharofermentanales bacterium]
MILQIKNKQKLYDSRPVRRIINGTLRIAVEHEALFEYLKIMKITPVFSVLLTDNSGIRKLNSRFRSIDKETDVLSFPAVDSDGKILTEVTDPDIDCYPDGHKELQLGDIVISLERVAAQAIEIGHSFEEETAFLTVHSFLHLIGYDHVDDAEEKVMKLRQKEIMNDIISTQIFKGEDNGK